MSVTSGLHQMVREHAGSAAAFDFDHTVLDGDVSLALLASIERNNPKDQRAVYEAACKRNVRDGYAALVETLVVGKTESEVWEDSLEVMEDGLASGEMQFFEPILDLLALMKEYQWKIWVVSASPKVCAAAAASLIGIEEDQVLGMWCKRENGRFVSPTMEPITYRQGKVDALTAVGCTEIRFAAGDAMTDLEMLTAAQYGLLVDRGDPTLRDAARRHGWWIIDAS